MEKFFPICHSWIFKHRKVCGLFCPALWFWYKQMTLWHSLYFSENRGMDQHQLTVCGLLRTCMWCLCWGKCRCLFTSPVSRHQQFTFFSKDTTTIIQRVRRATIQGDNIHSTRRSRTDTPVIPHLFILVQDPWRHSKSAGSFVHWATLGASPLFPFLPFVSCCETQASDTLKQTTRRIYSAPLPTQNEDLTPEGAQLPPKRRYRHPHSHLMTHTDTNKQHIKVSAFQYCVGLRSSCFSTRRRNIWATYCQHLLTLHQLIPIEQ